jgi:hypothetical protein
MHADKLGHQRGQLIDVLRPLPFNDDVDAFDVTEVTQARPQPLTCGTLEGRAKKPDARRFRLLRARREWPRCGAPPSSVMNWRRLMSDMGFLPSRSVRALRGWKIIPPLCPDMIFGSTRVTAGASGFFF